MFTEFPNLSSHIDGPLPDVLQNAIHRPYWIDTLTPWAAAPPHLGDITCDLAIVGGGYCGLWTAILARQRWPDARIVVLEAGLCGGAASGRNGGFTAPSISHGAGTAMERWPAEAETLIQVGAQNLDAFERDLEAFEIDAEFVREGKISLARTAWEAEGLRAAAGALNRAGVAARLLDSAALRGRFNSPLYNLGLWEPNYALVNPAKLVAGLRAHAMRQGIDIHEGTKVTKLSPGKDAVQLATAGGMVQAKRAVLATNVALPLLRRLRPTVIPVYDYALMTEPLSRDQLETIGWTGGHGAATSGNHFIYMRKSADNRILFGGYDAVYHFGSPRDEARCRRPATFVRLAELFAETFPSLATHRFSHAWGGVIDTSARTTFFAGQAMGGRVAYAMGFTGQGVTATRHAARVMLDRLAPGADPSLPRLAMTHARPVPFPPEPLRWMGIQLAQRQLAQEDKTGKRGLFLKTLDAFGVGYDS